MMRKGMKKMKMNEKISILLKKMKIVLNFTVKTPIIRIEV
jgi:hypothetical protein